MPGNAHRHFNRRSMTLCPSRPGHMRTQAWRHVMLATSGGDGGPMIQPSQLGSSGPGEGMHMPMLRRGDRQVT